MTALANLKFLIGGGVWNQESVSVSDCHPSKDTTSANARIDHRDNLF
jgi:hypothetical protein